MTVRRIASGLALLLGTTIVVAACGGAAATTAPTPTAAASEAAPSFGLPGFSFALPSFTSDAELEAMFPTEIGGQPVNVISMSGNDFVGSAGAQLMPVLQQLGKSPSDLSAAFGGTSQVTIIAFKINGVPAEQFLGAYTASVPGASIADASFGGKTVKKVVPATGETVYLYLKGDVVFTIGGTTTLTDALLNETFSKLP